MVWWACQELCQNICYRLYSVERQTWVMQDVQESSCQANASHDAVVCLLLAGGLEKKKKKTKQIFEVLEKLLEKF